MILRIVGAESAYERQVMRPRKSSSFVLISDRLKLVLVRVRANQYWDTIGVILSH